jgi:hypothetical protein
MKTDEWEIAIFCPRCGQETVLRSEEQNGAECFTGYCCYCEIQSEFQILVSRRSQSHVEEHDYDESDGNGRKFTIRQFIDKEVLL